MNPFIEIRTGSHSDIPRIKEAYDFLQSLEIPFSPRILSAHRTPHMMVQEAQNLQKKGFKVSIAAAGGSAHLPGMTASETLVPVVGIPVLTKHLKGYDSLFSIFQMPPGIPVGSVGVGQAKNAALLAAQIAYLNDVSVRNKIRQYKNLEPLPESFTLKPSLTIVAKESVYNDHGELLNDLSKGEIAVNKHTSLSDKVIQDASVVLVCVDLEKKEEISNLLKISSKTDVPIICVPYVSAQNTDSVLQSLDALTSPSKEDSPIALMGISRFTNGILYAQQILGMYFPNIQEHVKKHRDTIAKESMAKDEKLQKEGMSSFLS